MSDDACEHAFDIWLSSASEEDGDLYCHPIYECCVWAGREAAYRLLQARIDAALRVARVFDDLGQDADKPGLTEAQRFTRLSNRAAAAAFRRALTGEVP